MKIRLKDIIDLDYLIGVDDALDSKADIQLRAVRDRSIYNQCKNSSHTGKTLLLSWLAFRKEEFFKDADKKGLPLLPGDVFSFLYTWMVYAIIFLGGMAGISLAVSFLAYYGARPINVTVFITLFIILPVVLILSTLLLVVRRVVGKKKAKPGLCSSIFHTLISALFFNGVPKILKKVDWPVFKKSLDTLEYIASLIRMKNSEYRDLFFWPFFVLTSLFAFCFSAGALGGTFFRVIVSDMAFGWQSTLMTTSARIHEMISFAAFPWSWFVPETLAHPSFEQIEGSRIILKDGISVMATQDLVSWWPFLCLGILFYAVIPRGFLIIAGILAQSHVLGQFDFERPRFRQLFVRMQSPVLDIDTGESPVKPSPDNPVMEKSRIKEMKKKASFIAKPDISGGKAFILFSKTVYTDAGIKKIIQHIEQHLFLDVKEILGINFDFEKDTDAVRQMNESGSDQVILVHEVWQPPIRGVLYYIKQIKKAMPEGKGLYVLLTRDAGREDLSVGDHDIDFQVWQKAILKLEDSDIMVKRFL